MRKSSPLASTKYIAKTDTSRDRLLTSFGKATLKDRYLLEGETFQDLFGRVSSAYADDREHAQRLYDYMSLMWFMPATPILSNGGTKRGLPISCFLNEVDDTMEDIVSTWDENIWLASCGGGIGTYWGNVRSMGEKIHNKGGSTGIIPFIGVQDKLTLAISQGSLRRGSAAVYLPVSHPEIEEFIELRKPTGGDPNRKALNIHHGVFVTDDFMRAVEQDLPWELKSPKTGVTRSIIKARDLWIRLLLARVETGEPYIVFSGNVILPEVYKKLGLQIKTSNLCSEILLTTGLDHLSKKRTAVCCLSSLNLEMFEEWHSNEVFILDVMKFLDNVLQDFIDRASDTHARAKYSANRERSVGLGVMGLHSFLQSKSVPFESVVAKTWNKKIFKHIKQSVDKASSILAKTKGPCPDALDANLNERFTNKTAIAPTASISIIAGNTSPGIEPYSANTYMQKTLSGSFNNRNKHLEALLQAKNKNDDETWLSIMMHEGSVQHLDFLTKNEKLVFKTAFEIDQRWIIQLASDRTPYIDQGQSINIFLPSNVYKRDLHKIHFLAWKLGVKTLYYLRSKSLQRPDKISANNEGANAVQLEIVLPPAAIGPSDSSVNMQDSRYDECIACQ